MKGLLVHSEASDTQTCPSCPSPGYQAHLVLGTVHQEGAGRGKGALLERNPKEAREEFKPTSKSFHFCSRACGAHPNSLTASCGRPQLPQGCQLHSTKLL